MRYPESEKERADRKSRMKLFLKFRVLKSVNVEMEPARWVPSKMDDQRPPPRPVMREQNRDHPSGFQRENPGTARDPISEWLWRSHQHSQDPEDTHGSNTFEILKENGAIFRLAQREMQWNLVNCNKLPSLFLIGILFPSPLEGCYTDKVSQQYERHAHPILPNTAIGFQTWPPYNQMWLHLVQAATISHSNLSITLPSDLPESTFASSISSPHSNKWISF